VGVVARLPTIVCVPSSMGELERVAAELLPDNSEPVLVRDVVDALAERELAYTTGITMLNLLTKKGFVRREPGRRTRLPETPRPDLGGTARTDQFPSQQRSAAVVSCRSNRRPCCAARSTAGDA
jgi:hypothetical protein